MSVADPNRLDIEEAFRFPFRSKGWLPKLLLLDLWALLSFTVIGLFVFYGYLVEVSRQARAGNRDLPAWDRLGSKLHDGWFLSIAFLIWFVPLLIVAVLYASAASCTSLESGERTCTANGVVTLLVVLASVLYYLLLPGIWAQFLAGGLKATLDVAAVFRRAFFKPGLTLLVLLLYIATIFIAAVGVIGLLVGVLITYPYAFVIQGHLYGQFAKITDRAVTRKALPQEG